MKKLIIIAVLIAAMAGAMYAQDLKFDGYLNSGVGLVTDDNEDNHPYLKAFGVDSEHHGYRFRLNGSYTNEAKNAGARFRLQSQTNLSAMSNPTIKFNPIDVVVDPVTGEGTVTPTATISSTPPNIAGYFSLPYAFGWVSFLENKVILNAGIIDDSTWTTGDFWLANDSASHFAGLGALLKLAPVDGLVLGTGFYTMNRLSSSNNNVLANLNALGRPIVWDDARYTIHAAYTMKDVFRAGVSWRNENKAGGGAGEQNGMLYGEFRFLGVKDLTAVVATSLDNLGENFESNGNIILSETFGYKITKELSAGLNAVQFLYNRTDANDDKVDMNPGLLFNLWGSYTIDKVVPRLDVVYFMGGRSKVVSGGNTNGWERKGFAAVARAEEAKNDLSVFSIRPSVRINLDSRTFLEIGDIIHIDSAAGDNAKGVYKDSNDAEKNSRLTNVFYVDLKISF